LEEKAESWREVLARSWNANHGRALCYAVIGLGFLQQNLPAWAAAHPGWHWLSMCSSAVAFVWRFYDYASKGQAQAAAMKPGDGVENVGGFS